MKYEYKMKVLRFTGKTSEKGTYPMGDQHLRSLAIAFTFCSHDVL